MTLRVRRLRSGTVALVHLRALRRVAVRAVRRRLLLALLERGDPADLLTTVAEARRRLHAAQPPDLVVTIDPDTTAWDAATAEVDRSDPSGRGDDLLSAMYRDPSHPRRIAADEAALRLRLLASEEEGRARGDAYVARARARRAPFPSRPIETRPADPDLL